MAKVALQITQTELPILNSLLSRGYAVKFEDGIIEIGDGAYWFVSASTLTDADDAVRLCAEEE